MYNILLGGAAGDGLETMASLFEKILKKSGCHVFTIRDFMSRIRGGHNFIQIRFGEKAVKTHRDNLDIVVAMNEETFALHSAKLNSSGIILCDNSLQISDKRAIKLPLKETAKSIGNAKALGSIAVGALLKLFGLSLEVGQAVMAENFKKSILDINVLAIKEGYELAENRFSVGSTSLQDHILLTGTTAMALGALAADMKFYSAYPMSPSTGLLEYFTAHGEDLGIAVEQAEDEIAAITMAIGASYAGAKAMTGTSGGGFSLMVEQLGYCGIAEVPLVIANVQRPGPATGLPTRTEQSDLKFVISASQGEFPRMVIAIKHCEDSFYQTARAFALAEKYQIPVILLSDQHVGDSTATVKIFDTDNLYSNSAVQPDIQYKDGLYRRYVLTENGISPRLIPGRTEHLVRADSDEHDEHGFITEASDVRNSMVEKRDVKMRLLEQELLEPDFIGAKDFDTLLVGFGSTYCAIEEAISILNQDGGRYAALVFGDIFPLPTKSLLHYSAMAKQIINVEQNFTGQLASLIRETVCIKCQRSILKYDGRQLSVDEIVSKLKMFEKEGESNE